MTLQIVVFVLYLGVVLWIGWYSLRHTGDESDYWIAGGKLGWVLGGATLAATHVSAGTFIGTIGIMYGAGWSFGWLILSIPLAYWFNAAVLAPRFTRVRELTIPAFMETRYYSKRVRALAAVIIVVAYVVYIQAQIVAGGLIASTVFGLSLTWSMVGFTAMLLGYTVVGGMLADVYTDFFQLIVMVVGVVFAVPIAVAQVGGVEELFTYVQAVRPRHFSWESFPPALLFSMGLAFFLGSVAGPEKLVRLYAMKDMRTIRRGILFAIVTITGTNLLIFFLSLTSVVLFPALPTGDLAMPMVTRAVLPLTLGTMMLAAVASAMLSTVDSLLLVAGSALSYDIWQNLVDPRVSAKRRLAVARLGTLLVGSVPVVLVLLGVGRGALVQIIVLLFTALMGASFFVPVLLGVYWPRATREGAAAAMLGGVTVTLLWKVWGPAGVDPVLPGVLSSLALMVGVSLLTPPPPPAAVEPYFGAGARPLPSASPPSPAQTRS